MSILIGHKDNRLLDYLYSSIVTTFLSSCPPSIAMIDFLNYSFLLGPRMALMSQRVDYCKFDLTSCPGTDSLKTSLAKLTSMTI